MLVGTTPALSKVLAFLFWTPVGFCVASTLGAHLGKYFYHVVINNELTLNACGFVLSRIVTPKRQCQIKKFSTKKKKKSSILLTAIVPRDFLLLILDPHTLQIKNGQRFLADLYHPRVRAYPWQRDCFWYVCNFALICWSLIHCRMLHTHTKPLGTALHI